ncbi:MAG: transposase-like protein [Candidatus Paceibacteria bacterium]|jgi:transposase-like protein
MFKPPFCPRRDCSQHRSPRPNFYYRHGFYHPNCRSHAVPRFRCRTCRRTFSRQTFRMDYRDQRPDLNAPLFNLISMGVGIRMSSRRLGLSLRCTELKLRKIARHLRQQNLTLRAPLDGEVQFVFDEFETFETHRSLCPLSVPVLIEKTTRYCVWAESATIRPRGKMTEKRLENMATRELKHGRRRDRSRRAIRRTLQRGKNLLQNSAVVRLYTDQKLTYPVLARAAFGASRLRHYRTNSKVARTTHNPLFPINHEEARMRDAMGRLRRESWLVSKKRRYLDLALQVHMAHRNFVRKRFNGDQESPAQLLGFVHRRMTRTEALSWRQCWGKQSLHPLSRGGQSVASYQVAMGIAA